MAIEIVCIRCGHAIWLADDQFGGQVTCPACGEMLLVAETATGPPAPLAPSARRRAWGQLIAYALVVFIVGLAVSMVGMMLLSVQWETQADLCAEHLQLIDRALQSYHDEHGCYPPPVVRDAAGLPLHSWRVLILPHLGHEELYERYHFNEPWDGPHNRRLTPEMPSVYGCPQNPERSTGRTSYAALVGPNRMFDPQRVHRRAELDPARGSALVIIEVADIDWPWLQPVDVPIEQLPAQVNDFTRPGLSSFHRQGAHALSADGHCWTLTGTIAPEHRQPPFTAPTATSPASTPNSDSPTTAPPPPNEPQPANPPPEAHR